MLLANVTILLVQNEEACRHRHHRYASKDQVTIHEALRLLLEELNVKHHLVLADEGKGLPVDHVVDAV